MFPKNNYKAGLREGISIAMAGSFFSLGHHAYRAFSGKTDITQPLHANAFFEGLSITADYAFYTTCFVAAIKVVDTAYASHRSSDVQDNVRKADEVLGILTVGIALGVSKQAIAAVDLALKL